MMLMQRIFCLVSLTLFFQNIHEVFFNRRFAFAVDLALAQVWVFLLLLLLIRHFIPRCCITVSLKALHRW